VEDEVIVEIKSLSTNYQISSNEQNFKFPRESSWSLEIGILKLFGIWHL